MLRFVFLDVHFDIGKARVKTRSVPTILSKMVDLKFKCRA